MPITLAGIEGIALFGSALEYPAAALGAFSGHLDDERLCKAALGIRRACKEAAEFAGFYDHLLAADIAVFVAELVGHLYPHALERLFGVIELNGEIAVKLMQEIFPIELAGLDAVELLLHVVCWNLRKKL